MRWGSNLNSPAKPTDAKTRQGHRPAGLVLAQAMKALPADRGGHDMSDGQPAIQGDLDAGPTQRPHPVRVFVSSTAEDLKALPRGGHVTRRSPPRCCRHDGVLRRQWR